MSTRRLDTTNAYDTPANREFVLLVHQRLSEVYGRSIRYFHDLDPLSELVSALLSHRTKNADSGRAFRQLLATFGNWEAVRDAPTGAVESAIAPCTWPEQKAPRIQEVLRLVGERHGALSLEFLAGMDVAAARQWLEELPGVGPKTSAAVLSFSNLRGRALPVDSHHFRVAVRLGIIAERLGEARANRALESLLPHDFTAQEVYDHHQVMMRHGQKVCFYRAPDCRNCVLLDLCPTGNALLGDAPATDASCLPPAPDAG
ncbi:MAG: Fe-S cluster assembly protein HesB [Chitinophagaceae bacterium]|nr:MAG: Fe-S cluster assembly protein HesB [Chitinophagaceae bacterium]